MIPFVDLATQYNHLKDEINEGIQKVLNHGGFILGPEVKMLEDQLSEYIGVKHCISCSNGTDALLMPLMAWRIGVGDAVFTTPFTFIATAEVISLLGATPVFVDIDPKSFNLDPDRLEQSIIDVIQHKELTPRAIITVDLSGFPADYDRIEAIGKKYNLKVIEDAAQGFGGVYKGRKIGSLGDVGATSFFPSKPLGCYGDGGAIFIDDDDLASTLKSIRVHGKGKDKYDNLRIGLNARLDTIQAAILLAKFKAFTEYELEARNRFAQIYTDMLGSILETPDLPEGLISSWAFYSVLAKDKDERALIRNRLQESGIPTMIYYSKPLHLQDVYQVLGYQGGDFPITEDVSERIFSLPMHPYLTEDLIGNIVSIIKETLKERDSS